MKYILPNLLYLAFLLTACGSNKHEALENLPFETIKIDLDRIPKVKMSTFFDEVEYIPLETNGIPLGRGRYKIFGEKIYYHEYLGNERVSAFGLDGKVRGMLDKNGRGPGEFLEASDFFVDEHSGIIELLDNRIGKIHYYDSLGVFIESKEFRFGPSSIFKKRDKHFSWLVNASEIRKDSCLIILDEKLKPITKFFPASEMLENVAIGDFSNFHEYNDDLFLSFSLNDTVYKITDSDEITPEFVLDFGKHKIPEEIRHGKFNSNREFINKLKERGLVLAIIHSIQNDEWLVFMFRSYKTGSLFMGLYSKQHKKVFYSSSFENDVDRGILGIPFHMTDDYMYTMIEPYELLQKIREEGTVVHKGTKLWELLQDMDENSNPVVMKCRFKSTNR